MQVLYTRILPAFSVIAALNLTFLATVPVTAVGQTLGRTVTT